MRREAQSEADALRREGQIEAREASVRLRAEIEQEVGERRTEILKIEERVLAKEEDIDREADGAHAAGAGGRSTARCTPSSSRKTSRRRATRR